LQNAASATLGTAPGANVVQIQDTQPPMPTDFALTSNGIKFTFSENVFVPSQISNLALSMYKNGDVNTEYKPTGVTGAGTADLTIQYGTSLGATDWAAFVYAGRNTGNAVQDRAGNVLTLEEEGTEVIFVVGRDGNNTIVLPSIPPTEIEIKGFGGNDTITGHAGTDFISGGAGADTLTGGLGKDVFNFEQGDSPVVTGLNLGNDGVNTGDTFSFANGVDRITDFTRGDRINLTRPYSDFFGNDVGYMGYTPSDGLATDQGYFVVRGNYNDSSKTFNVNTSAGSDTLIVWDGDPTGGVTQTGIVLSGVTPDKLSLGHGWIGHL